MPQSFNWLRSIMSCILLLAFCSIFIGCFSTTWVNKRTGEKSVGRPELPHGYEECYDRFHKCIESYCGKPPLFGSTKRWNECKVDFMMSWMPCSESDLVFRCKDRLAREAGWEEIN